MSEPKWIADIAKEYNGCLHKRRAGDIWTIIHLLAHVRELREQLARMVWNFEHTPGMPSNSANYVTNSKRLLSRETPPEMKP